MGSLMGSSMVERKVEPMAAWWVVEMVEKLVSLKGPMRALQLAGGKVERLVDLLGCSTADETAAQTAS